MPVLFTSSGRPRGIDYIPILEEKYSFLLYRVKRFLSSALQRDRQEGNSR